MKTRIFYIIIAVLVLLIVGLYIYQNQQSNIQSSNTSTTNVATPDSNTNDMMHEEVMSNTNTAGTTNSETTTTPQANTNTSSEGRFSSEADIDAPDIMVHEVVYNGTAFSPASLNITNGDIVVFKNESSGTFWPASDPHPSHSNYPAFDADAAVAAGELFQFKFTKNGTWGYHNHQNPSAKGTIIVK